MRRRNSCCICRSHGQPHYRRLAPSLLSRANPSKRTESKTPNSLLTGNLQELAPGKLLLQCLRSGEQGAWVEFVHRFQPLIASVITKTIRRCLNPAVSLVDDLVQETFLKLCLSNFKALRDFDCRHEHALAGFLKVVASTVAQDYLRGSLSQKRGSGKGEEDLEKATPTAHSVANSAAVMEQAIMFRQIERCLERQCSEPNFKRDRKIFSLYYRHGLTADAIARRPDIGLTEKGVESALFRTIKNLRAQVQNRPPRGAWQVGLHHLTHSPLVGKTLPNSEP